MKSLVVEGWRRSCHSYALVNQHQLLQLLMDRRFELFHVDTPFFRSHWAQLDAGFPAAARSALESLRPPPPAPVDVIYRISWPLRVHPGAAPRIFVFGTCEMGKFEPGAFVGPSGSEQGVAFDAVELVTPSHWSRTHFIRLGFAEQRVHVIPHGIDPSLFGRPPPALRPQVRSALNVPQDAIVFLNVGAMTWNKGIGPMLAAFALCRLRDERAILLLKGGDALYGNMMAPAIEEARQLCPEVTSPVVMGSLRYVPQNLTQSGLMSLYNASDVYLSPYRAEGFNLPVLEARAAGLPVIVTDGGSTDDFCDTESCLRVAASIQTGEHGMHLEPVLESIVACMQRVTEDLPDCSSAARRAAPRVLEQYSWLRVTRRLGDLLVR